MEFCQEQHLYMHWICPLFILTIILEDARYIQAIDQNFLNIYRRYETPLGDTVVDLINARGVYLILGVQKGAFNRNKEAFKRERRFFSHVQ